MADEESTISDGGDEGESREPRNSLDGSGSELEDNTADADEGAVPPGYDWPTHGGYLGCLLSLVASCLVGGFLGTTLFAALGYWHVLPSVVTLLLTIGVFVAVAIGFGRLGWILGKRFYRDYSADQPGGHRESGRRPTGATEPDLSDRTDAANVPNAPNVTP
ncbi:MAG: hypothetical protein ACLQUY_19820 [Ktedonobacterales bacterium]